MPSLSYWGNNKPPAGVGLNYGHPLCQNLVFALPFNEGAGAKTANIPPYPAASLTTLGGTYSTPEWGRGKYGTKLYFQGVDTAVILGRASNIVTSRMTFAALIDRRGVGTYTYDAPGIVFNRGASTVSGLDLYDTTKLGYHWDSDANTYNFSGGPTVPTDRLVFVALSVRPDRGLLYANGDIAINSVTHAVVTFSTPDSFAVGTGEPTSFTRTFNGDIYGAWVWTRDLSPAELASMAAQPWQMYQAPIWRRSFVRVASTTNPSRSIQIRQSIQRAANW